MVTIVQNLFDMIALFSDVAGTDPISATLLAIGALLVVVPSIVFGGLAIAGVLDWIVPESFGQPSSEHGPSH